MEICWFHSRIHRTGPSKQFGGCGGARSPGRYGRCTAEAESQTGAVAKILLPLCVIDRSQPCNVEGRKIRGHIVQFNWSESHLSTQPDIDASTQQQCCRVLCAGKFCGGC